MSFKEKVKTLLSGRQKRIKYYIVTALLGLVLLIRRYEFLKKGVGADVIVTDQVAAISTSIVIVLLFYCVAIDIADIIKLKIEDYSKDDTKNKNKEEK